MKNSGQVAKKNKAHAVQASKKNVLKKGPVVKGKNTATVPRGGKIQKNGSEKKLPSAKNGKNKKSEGDDNDDEEASDIDNSEESIENGNGGELVDSDSDSDDEEDKADVQQDDDGEDSDEDDDEEGEGEQEEQNDDDDDDNDGEDDDNDGEDDDNDGEDDDEAPEEVPSKVENKPDYIASKIYVRRLNRTTPDEQIVKAFESFGKIKEIIIKKKKGHRNEAAIIFEDEAASKAALKMNNAIIDDKNINVVHANIQRSQSSTTHSVIIKNVDNLAKVESSKLEQILLKCGELDDLTIICERNILAFVKFKNADSVEKALKLDGTTQNGLQICISAYTGKSHKVKIFVKNIERSTTEEDLRKFFEICGPIVNISLKTNPHLPSTAVVVFEKQESYCQAFLLHEELLNGRPLFLEPFSEKTCTKIKRFKKEFGKRPNKGMWKGGPLQKKMRK